jgi:hypothetical protein
VVEGDGDRDGRLRAVVAQVVNVVTVSRGCRIVFSLTIVGLPRVVSFR